MLEAPGVSTVMLCAEAFLGTAVVHAWACGHPETRVVAVHHTLATRASEAVLQRADAVVERIITQ